jgi:hypothetical protein
MNKAPKLHREKHCGSCGQKVQIVNGEWLRWLREQTGESLRSFARWLDVSPTYVSDIERNLREANKDIVGLYEQRAARWGVGGAPMEARDARRKRG